VSSNKQEIKLIDVKTMQYSTSTVDYFC